MLWPGPESRTEPEDEKDRIRRVDAGAGSRHVACVARAIVGAGSNLGSREAFLRAAEARLATEVDVRGRSRLYLTDPIGPPQPDFANAAFEIETDRSPHDTLALLLAIERSLGRVRNERWGPRTLDLDLLWWDGPPIATLDLTLPHPRLRERAFALAPLLDVAPDLAPRYGAALAALGSPPPRAWTVAERTDATVRVEALDLADALALAVTAHLGGGPASRALILDAPDPEGWITRATAIPGARGAAIERCDPSEVRGILLCDGSLASLPASLDTVCGQVVVIAGAQKVR